MNNVKTEKDLEEVQSKWVNLYQTATEENTLVGVHNLSAENLRHAIKMGGIANATKELAETRRVLGLPPRVRSVR